MKYSPDEYCEITELWDKIKELEKSELYNLAKFQQLDQVTTKLREDLEKFNLSVSADVWDLKQKRNRTKEKTDKKNAILILKEKSKKLSSKQKYKIALDFIKALRYEDYVFGVEEVLAELGELK
jgi:hypothetical protein